MNTKTLVIFIGIIAVLLVAFYVIGRTGNGDNPGAPPPQPPPPKLSSATINKYWDQLVKNAAGPALGNPNAPWTIIECGDFECPNCGKSRPVVEKLVSDSGGKVKLYFINFPLVQIHHNALGAAEASLAANAQGKFWPEFNVLYSHQDELVPSEIQYYSSSIPGLDTKQLAADIASKKYAPAVANEAQLVQKLGVEATPTFLVRATNGGQAQYYVGLEHRPNTMALADLVKAQPWNQKAPMVASAAPAAHPHP